MRLSPFYDLLSGAYGVATIAFVNAAGFPTVYNAKPTDFAILLDVSGYGGAGPTVNWTPTPSDVFPVMIRNTAGSLATHNVTVNPPPNWTIEDPANVGTFSSSITLATAFESGSWIADRARSRLVLYPPPGGGGTGVAPTLQIATFNASNAAFPAPVTGGYLVYGCGGGGGGGGGENGDRHSAGTVSAGGGGGGAAEWCIGIPVTLTIGTLLNISIGPGGAGGTGGVNGGANATDGSAGTASAITSPGPVGVADFPGGAGGKAGGSGNSGIATAGGGPFPGFVNGSATTAPLLGAFPGAGGTGGPFGTAGGASGAAGSGGSPSKNGTVGNGGSGGTGGAGDGSTHAGGSGGGGGGGGRFGSIASNAGGNGGTGSPQGGSGAAGASAPANSGAGGGGGGAGGGSDTVGGPGGAGGVGGSGCVILVYVQ